MNYKGVSEDITGIQTTVKATHPFKISRQSRTFPMFISDFRTENVDLISNVDDVRSHCISVAPIRTLRGVIERDIDS
jgi:hypothetical protein